MTTPSKILLTSVSLLLVLLISACNKESSSQMVRNSTDTEEQNTSSNFEDISNNTVVYGDIRGYPLFPSQSTDDTEAETAVKQCVKIITPHRFIMKPDY